MGTSPERQSAGCLSGAPCISQLLGVLLRLMQAEPMPVTLGSEALAPILTLDPPHGVERLDAKAGHASDFLAQL